MINEHMLKKCADIRVFWAGKPFTRRTDLIISTDPQQKSKTKTLIKKGCLI